MIVEDRTKPWFNRERCILPGFVVRSILDDYREDPCDGCWQSRAKCGGQPRKDGQECP